ncbi:MAG TPA: oligosaccharide flippase family protein [Usitatibacter sp.]|nr:oligosaccharide flippase family protein [Usitatibacter sp.]
MSGPNAHPTPLLSIAKNAFSLTGGRMLLALLRFVVALVIVQRAGIDRFGEFALILGFVFVAEWLSDFGLTDIAVRQVSADPSRRTATLTAFALSKALQSLIAAATMGCAIALLGYPQHMVRAGLIAAAAVIFYGGVQVYRVEFRLRMTMERDVAAELFCAVVLLASVWFVTRGPVSVEMLALCYAISRAVNLLAAGLLAGGWPHFKLGHNHSGELRLLAAAALPLGMTGLLVSVYDAMDAIALSQWSTNAEVGIFSVATRTVALAVVAEQALATAVFPVLAAQWVQDRGAFARTMQAILDWGTVFGAGLFCALHAGAHGLGALVKHDSGAIAEVLQLLSIALLAKVIVTLVSPMVVIAGRLFFTVWISVLVVAAKLVGLMVLAPLGAMGAAAAYLIAEVGVGLIPTVILCQRAAGMQLRWSVPLRALAAACAIAAACRWLGLEGTLVHGALAFAAFMALATALGAVRLQPLRQLFTAIAQRRSGRA